LDYYPCWYCLKYFKKVDWLMQFPDNPWSQDILRSRSGVQGKGDFPIHKDIPVYQQASVKSRINGSSFKPGPEVIETALSRDEGALIHLETKLSYALNRTGLRIWSLLKEGNCAHEIVEKLHEEFEVDRDRLKKDVVSLIEELELLKLIIPSNKEPMDRTDITLP